MSCVDMWRCRGIRHDDACVLLITEGMYYAQQPATLDQCYSKGLCVYMYGGGIPAMLCSDQGSRGPLTYLS